MPTELLSASSTRMMARLRLPLSARFVALMIGVPTARDCCLAQGLSGTVEAAKGSDAGGDAGTDEGTGDRSSCKQLNRGGIASSPNAHFEAWKASAT
jgi:hypothetical protein